MVKEKIGKKRKSKYIIGRGVEVLFRSGGLNKLVSGFLLSKNRKKSLNSRFILLKKEKDVDVFRSYPFFVGGSYRSFQFLGAGIGLKKKVSKLTEARLK